MGGQGQAGLAVPWDHGSVIFCTHFLHCSQVMRAFTEGGEGMVPSPSHPEGPPFTFPILLESTHVFQHFHTFHPPWCKPQCKVASSSCMLQREPHYPSQAYEAHSSVEFGRAFVSTGLGNLPITISAPVTVKVCMYCYPFMEKAKFTLLYLITLEFENLHFIELLFSDHLMSALV